MYRIYPDSLLIIDEEMKNQTVDWYSSDNKNEYRKHVGKDYYTWTDAKIEYKFNSLGYRTKELKDLEDDFFLTFGCSYSEGVGINADQIWNHYIAQNLNLDLYNCAKQATGLDIQYINAMLWDLNKLPNPKLVIVQWPHKARKSFVFNERDCLRLEDQSELKTPDGYWWGRRYISDTGEMSMNVITWFESFNNIWKLKGVPVFNFTWDDDLSEELTRSKYQLWKIKPKTFDKGRDYMHDGPQFHKETADKILDLLKLSNFTDKI